MDHIFKLLDWLNEDCSIHGILVQLPLPKEIDQYQVFDHINPLKDVDVFVPENVGLLLQGRPRFVPCTPAAIQELLTRNKIPIEGKKVTIINRSDVVGKPLKSLLIQNNEQANATVTICHDHTPPELLRDTCLASDIIVVAVGKPKFLTAEMVPVGAVVVDVGINRIEGSNKIVGDVDFEAVSGKASWISPVPGGVGPMTISCLLKNVLTAQQLLLDSQCAES
jgi:methylenetetrahydrofolate dehydrogenase (NADP+)/methenyltetrahydrofolate cyclohydrolase